MTNQEKQALSQALADKYGIEAYTRKINIAYADEVYDTWLHDDWARLMPLAVKHRININPDNEVVECYHSKSDWKSDIDGDSFAVSELYKDHNDKYEAVRIAICRALLEKEL